MSGPLSLSRRRLLGLGGAAAGALTLGASLAACGLPEFAPAPLAGPRHRGSGSQPLVRFANWPAYTDRSPANPAVHPTLAEFTARTGIQVDYSEPITGNEVFLGRIGIPLAMGRSTGYDVVVLSDWVVAQLIRLGWAEPLSPDLVPDAGRLLPRFRDWPVPDVRRYSLPWQGGFTGIVYNARVTGRPVTGVMDLLTSADLRGKVTLVEDMRDVTGLVMLELGSDPGDFSQAEFAAAVSVLQRSVQSGQVAYVSNYYLPPLIKGRIAACVGWAGDALFASNPDIRFAWPATGGMIWTDNMVIPAFAAHRENAERLIAWYYQPRIAAQLSAYEMYLCPVSGSQAAMRRLDPALAAQRYIFPSAELLASGHTFRVLTPAESAAFTSSDQAAVGL